MNSLGHRWLTACAVASALAMAGGALSGCASAQANQAEAASAAAATKPPLEGQRNMRETLAWQGRLAVQYEQNGKPQSLSASFSWQQDASQTRIQLSSPTGQIVADIIVTPTSASFTQAGQVTRSFANIDQLTQELLGWPLPVAGLREWLQGFGVDAKGQRFSAVPGQDQTWQTSDGWRIRYASWHDASQPKRIDLERHIDTQAIDVSLRIVLEPQS